MVCMRCTDMVNTSVAFNPNDPIQQSFLSALALGETGNSSYAATEGVGGANLANLQTQDEYGFPEWGGQGSSHAAGIFQFQPGTWDEVASKYNLNFGSTTDQEAGAWYYAQQVYGQKTGSSLYGDLMQGNLSKLDQALSSAWPSVMGNASAKQGLAATILGGGGANIPFPVAHNRLVTATLLHSLQQARLRLDYWVTSKTGLNAVG